MEAPAYPNSENYNRAKKTNNSREILNTVSHRIVCTRVIIPLHL